MWGFPFVCLGFFILTVAGPGVFDLEDEASQASGPIHLTLVAVRGVIAGAHAVSRITLGTLALAHETSPSARSHVPQARLSFWTADLVARLGV